MRLLVYGPNTPIRAADFSSPGGMITVVPDGYQEDLDALAKATTIIIKFRAGRASGAHGDELDRGKHRRVLQDLHACRMPAALYEETTHHILCPCHQSTFDAPVARRCFSAGGPAAAAVADHHGLAGLPGRAERLPRTGRPELLGAGMSTIDKRWTAPGSGSTTGSASPARPAGCCGRSSRITGRSCSARSPSTPLSSCCSPARSSRCSSSRA